MLNGLQMLEAVDARLRQVEGEAAAAQSELDWLAARRDHARGEEAGALRALAQIRLSALRTGGDAELQRLDEADRRAQALLTQHRAIVASAQAELAAARPALGAAESDRARHADALHAVEAAAEKALADAREAVLADPAWQAARDAAEAASRVVEHAERKASFARQDSEAKGRSYLADPLFAYLWRRHFGTPQYQAGLFTRLVDRWAARVARFEPARRNYAMLIELPRQLAAHAARMREAADAAANSVSDRARRIAGVASSDEVAGLRAALEAAEARLEALRGEAAAIEARIAAASSGDDALIREAVAALEAALGQASLQSLRAAAARTPMPDDDAIVSTLEQAHAVREEAEAMLVQRRAGLQAVQAQVNELRQVRQEMRAGGYGESRWNFGNDAMVGLLLGELLRGAVSRGGFWERLNQQRVADPWGAPRGPARPAQSAWSSPPMHDPWGSVGGAPSGSFGSGGFRTGGTTTSGGFRTGGSF